MIDDQEPRRGDTQADRATYVAPALRVVGTVEQLTEGPDPGAGDDPSGVISF